MPEQWMSLAAAAACLNCHTRTIERRIAAGKIQTRRTDDGQFGQQLQVLINLPDRPHNQQNPSPTSPGVGAEALETVKELAQDQVSLATGSASALVKFAQDDAIRARDELHLARLESARVRKESRFAWAAVAAMATAVCLAVGWTSHRITRSDDQIRSMNETSAAIRAETRQLLIERDQARQDAQTARLAAAESTGRLAAMKETVVQTSDKRPTTQPTAFLQRLFAGLSDQ
jgi:hypothetical protein